MRAKTLILRAYGFSCFDARAARTSLQTVSGRCRVAGTEDVVCALSQHRGDDRMPDSWRADLVILARQPEKEITLDLGAHRDRSRSCLYPLSARQSCRGGGVTGGLFPELMAPQAICNERRSLGIGRGRIF